ncbi:3-oxoacyl-ACP synthase [Altibacter sp. HG106]|uniref:3-oxoacyl-ACP synthase n=1 Tax=Altibacter sp. HG106 TaxID=3023937 RepID=UPI002350B294|nr:3-oxoacyl-ACP synthase [Altibacter sp. HG106]MDC7994692.1 3-oxoacyl-ACP synthase [Altibacter sp. HG106]
MSLKETSIPKFCYISNGKIWSNGAVWYADETVPFKQLMKGAYKQGDVNYPKFFKMDRLSKLAFMASEVISQEAPFHEETALVFANRASSLDSDRKHQHSIQHQEAYYPSPAVFVYTLPNICLGEISIRHQLFSENSFFIFDSFKAEAVQPYCNHLIATKKAPAVLCGWVDFDSETEYEAFLYLITNNTISAQAIQQLYKKHHDST